MNIDLVAEKKSLLVGNNNTFFQKIFLYLFIIFINFYFFSNASASLQEFTPLPKFKPSMKKIYDFEISNKNIYILSKRDIVLYVNIFYFQKKGQWHQANEEIKKLDNNILMGHVLFQRYMHPTAYRSSFSELSNWLKDYGDHPGAMRIYNLAKRRKPSNTKNPSRPKVVGFDSIKKRHKEKKTILNSLEVAKKKTKKQKNSKKTRAFIRKIKKQIRNEILTKSEQQVRAKSKSILSVSEADQLLWEIGSRWYFRGDNDIKAFELSSEAASRSREKVEIADWTAGLAAWRMGKTKKAQKHFEALAKSNTASSWNISAGAFWAARANLANNNPQKVKYWLEVGSIHKRTFYGLLCKKLLAKKISVSISRPQVTEKNIKTLMKVPGILRAIALKQIGQNYLADRETKQLVPTANALEINALLNLSNELSLPSTSIKLAKNNLKVINPYYDSTAYPAPKWLINKKNEIDRALIFAFVRQESSFNSRARSPAGAIGLMQLMPQTASFVARKRSLRNNKRYKLYEPELNLSLGQKYLNMLMRDESIGNNLFLLAAAYNAGPSNLRKWQKNIKYNDDPLLFIESIPAKETRLFIERVLSNYWIYRKKLHQDIPSMNDAAQGKWPSYFSMDKKKQLTTIKFKCNTNLLTKEIQCQ